VSVATTEQFEDIEKAYEKFGTITSAKFNSTSEAIDSCTISGKETTIHETVQYTELTDNGQLISFTAAVGNEQVLVKQERGSVSIKKINREDSDIQLPDWQSVYLIFVALVSATVYIDEFIDRNGLRPAVTELKRRRWIIITTTAVIAALLQID